MTERSVSYADAVASVARAEGNLDLVSDELFRVARALEGSDELRMTLSDRQIPAARRQQIVEDLLGDQASETTTAMVSMIVAAGRSSDLVDIARGAVELNARDRGRSVAEVRTAVGAYRRSGGAAGRRAERRNRPSGGDQGDRRSQRHGRRGGHHRRRSCRRIGAPPPEPASGLLLMAFGEALRRQVAQGAGRVRMSLMNVSYRGEQWQS